MRQRSAHDLWYTRRTSIRITWFVSNISIRSDFGVCVCVCWNTVNRNTEIDDRKNNTKKNEIVSEIGDERERKRKNGICTWFFSDSNERESWTEVATATNRRVICILLCSFIYLCFACLALLSYTFDTRTAHTQQWYSNSDGGSNIRWMWKTFDSHILFVQVVGNGDFSDARDVCTVFVNAFASNTFSKDNRTYRHMQ